MKKILKSKNQMGWLFLIGFFAFILCNNVEVIYFKNMGSEKIGIIDTYLNEKHECLFYFGIEEKKLNEKVRRTHGDILVSFIRNCEYKGTIYYFSAYENGKLSSENIVSGLEWMKENGVKKVNISLSSKRYNEELLQWIKDNKDVSVYSSYNNNLTTTADYPAMYDNVIASGFDNRMNYKIRDKKYRSNHILLLNSGVHYYHGNSFLSVITMLNELTN